MIIRWNIVVFWPVVLIGDYRKKPEEINSIEATEIEKNAKLTDEELAYILEVKTKSIFDKSQLR